VRYVALITGEGEGCDHTIDCNKKFEVMEDMTDSEAIKALKKYFDEWGHDHIANIQLFSIEAEVALPFKQWKENAERDEMMEEMEAELEDAEAKVDELRNKLKKRGEK